MARGLKWPYKARKIISDFIKAPQEWRVKQLTTSKVDQRDAKKNTGLWNLYTWGIYRYTFFEVQKALKNPHSYFEQRHIIVYPIVFYRLWLELKGRRLVETMGQDAW